MGTEVQETANRHRQGHEALRGLLPEEGHDTDAMRALTLPVRELPLRHDRNVECIEQMKDLRSEEILPILQSRWLFCDDIARIVIRGLRTGKNVLLWGPGGHGKSEITDDILKLVKLYDDTFTLDFGDGTFEDSLWGGIDFKRLDSERVLAYHPERSFLNYPVAKFEELLDAPPPTVNALKNTLTKRELHKDADPFPMETRCIIATTNRNPEEFARQSQSNDALIQRFPLRLKVDWPRYDEHSYRSLFEVRGLGDPATRAAFATLIAQTVPSGSLSPRTICHAFSAVLDAGRERGADTLLSADDLKDLRYFPGFPALDAKKVEEFENSLRAQKIHEFLADARGAATEIKQRLKNIKSMEPQEIVEWRGTLDVTRAMLSKLSLTDAAIVKERDELVREISSSIDSLDSTIRERGRPLRWVTDAGK